MDNKFKFNLPSHLDENFKIVRIKKINLSKLKIGVTNKKSRKLPSYFPIKKTPHFSFVKSYILGKAEESCLGYKNYKEYNEYNKHYLNEKNFKELIDNIISKGYQEKTSRIICLRELYNPLNGSYKVLDGSHRLAIISFLNFKKVDISIAKYKQNFLKRKVKFL